MKPIKQPKPIPSTPVRSNRGFALVVTLTLLILLTVIAVGLLSPSSIAMRTTSSDDARSIARANARMLS